MRVKDKTFVVTGGANGIGRQVVLSLLKRGASVAAVDRDDKGLNALLELTKEYGAAIDVFVTDITRVDDVKHTISAIIERFVHIDGMINVAGIIQPFVDVVDLEITHINRVMDVNFYGTVYMVKALLPHLLEQKEAHIVNVSSMGGFIPVPGQSAYGASKAAVKLFTEGLYAELIETNIRVSLVFPGAVETEITKNSGAKLDIDASQAKTKMLSAEKCATIIIKGMEKNKFRIMAGSDAKLLDRLLRLMPTRTILIIAKKMKQLKVGKS